MYEVYSNGTFSRPKEEQVANSGCGQRLITLDHTTSPKRPTEASTLDANKPGHLSEDDYTAGSGPDLMQ